MIVWDLSGLGKSRKPTNRDYSLENASDLNAVLAIARDQPVILLENSMRAMLLLTFARLFPEQLGQQAAGLVLVYGTYTNLLETAILSKLLRALQKPLLEPLFYWSIARSPLLWLLSWLNYLNGSTLLTTKISESTGTETWGQLNFSSLRSHSGISSFLLEFEKVSCLGLHSNNV